MNTSRTFWRCTIPVIEGVSLANVKLSDILWTGRLPLRTSWCSPALAPPSPSPACPAISSSSAHSADVRVGARSDSCHGSSSRSGNEVHGNCHSARSSCCCNSSSRELHGSGGISSSNLLYSSSSSSSINGSGAGGSSHDRTGSNSSSSSSCGGRGRGCADGLPPPAVAANRHRLTPHGCDWRRRQRLTTQFTAWPMPTLRVTPAAAATAFPDAAIASTTCQPCTSSGATKGLHTLARQQQQQRPTGGCGQPRLEAASQEARRRAPAAAGAAAEVLSGTTRQTRGAARARVSNGGSEGGVEGSGGSECGGGDGRVLSLRAALRLLYKRVHPDLFHDHPTAKEENERSFKLLQEYMQLARGGDTRSPAARVPYRFAFYLRQAARTEDGRVDEGEEEEEEDGTSRGASYTAVPPLRPPVGGQPASALLPPLPAPPEPGDGSDLGGGGDSADIPGLRLVRIMLPPPAIRPPGVRDLAGPTRKALVKLLAACGLTSSGRDSEEGWEEEGKREGGGLPLSLAAFLPEAVEQLRQAEAARPSDPAVRVANLRGALRLHHQVMVSFSDKQLPPVRQVELLERLVRVVEAAAAGPSGLRLQGCHVVIGDRLGLDRVGHLCLAASEPDDAWADFLTGVDTDFVAQQRGNMQALRGLEARVARAAGVAQVFTTYGNLTEPSYREFLERLAAAAAACGPVGGGAFRDVSLCGLPPVPPAGPEASGRPSPQLPPRSCCRLDNSCPGVIQVAADAAATDVYDCVTALGGQAQAAVEAARRTEAQLRELSDKTRQRLRLRSLTRDPRVAPDHFRRACGLLLEQAAALMPLLEGCVVRVGFANRLAPDGSCIEIAHNCEL